MPNKRLLLPFPSHHHMPDVLFHEKRKGETQVSVCVCWATDAPHPQVSILTRRNSNFLGFLGADPDFLFFSGNRSVCHSSKAAAVTLDMTKKNPAQKFQVTEIEPWTRLLGVRLQIWFCSEGKELLNSRCIGIRLLSLI